MSQSKLSARGKFPPSTIGSAETTGTGLVEHPVTVHLPDPRFATLEAALMEARDVLVATTDAVESTASGACGCEDGFVCGYHRLVERATTVLATIDTALGAM